MGHEPPHGFVCPLSLEVMRDPVVTADGQTYERAEITEWLQAHDTSPITGLPLKRNGVIDKTLIPNIALKKAIQEWEKEDDIPVGLPVEQGPASNSLGAPQHDSPSLHSEEQLVELEKKRRILFEAVRTGAMDEVVRLLDSGLSIMSKNELGMTCLHLACKAGHVRMVDMLLKRGGTELLIAKDEDFWTCLHFAADQLDPAVVQRILAQPLSQENKPLLEATTGMHGWTPYDVAKRKDGKSEVFKLLKQQKRSSTSWGSWMKRSI